MDNKPRRGSLAICSRGYLGVITSDEPGHILYPDGNQGYAYRGIHLSVEMLGQQWSSRNPVIVGHVDQFKDIPIVETQQTSA